jgi:hypothetical protein
VKAIEEPISDSRDVAQAAKITPRNRVLFAWGEPS